MKLKRWLIIGLVVVGIVSLIAYGYKPKPVLVEAVEVKRGSLRVTIEEEGKTRVTDRFTVSPPIAGYARRVGLKVGDAVSQGQILFRLEPLAVRAAVLDPRTRAQASARLEAAQSALKSAEERAKSEAANVSYWQTQLARVKKLDNTRDIAREIVDRTITDAERADAALRSAQYQVDSAKSEVEAARAELEHSAAVAPGGGEMVVVRSPVGGRVLKVMRESEGAVNPGDAVIEIGNARVLEVEVEVLSADAVKIAPGSRVLLERWGGERPLEGRVRRVEPTAFTKVSALGVEEQRVRVIADITSSPDEWRALGDGYRVEASFILWESTDVLQIPASALFRQQDAWAVFVVDSSFARRRAVEVGRRNGLKAQIVKGLNGGERVIAHPDTTVEDGRAVEVR